MHALHKLTDRYSEQLYWQELSLPVGQARCLSVLGAFGALSVSALAQHANLDKAQASRAAQALVQAALVTRKGNTQDGRGIVLQLSAAGKARCAKMLRLVEQRNRAILACLNPVEQGQLSGLLDRLLSAARTISEPVPMPAKPFRL
jgi:DNA-binding MarR family transcriptional regulator